MRGMENAHRKGKGGEHVQQCHAVDEAVHHGEMLAGSADSPLQDLHRPEHQCALCMTVWSTCVAGSPIILFQYFCHEHSLWGVLCIAKVQKRSVISESFGVDGGQPTCWVMIMQSLVASFSRAFRAFSSAVVQATVLRLRVPPSS